MHTIFLYSYICLFLLTGKSIFEYLAQNCHYFPPLMQLAINNEIQLPPLIGHG